MSLMLRRGLIAGTFLTLISVQAFAISDAVNARRTFESSAITVGGTCHTLVTNIPSKATITSTGRLTGSPILTAPGMNARAAEASGTPYCREPDRSTM